MKENKNNSFDYLILVWGINAMLYAIARPIMDKMNKVRYFSILVIGMIFLSGCQEEANETVSALSVIPRIFVHPDGSFNHLGHIGVFVLIFMLSYFVNNPKRKTLFPLIVSTVFLSTSYMLTYMMFG